VLNAKHHEREAEIVSQAGRKSAITISTNMAGRGTDIMLGGNPEFMARSKAGPDVSEDELAKAIAQFKDQCEAEKREVIEAGGLFIMGTERHESRRIDNQLRGRSGRQGDPGVSRFYLSLEDDLLRVFGGERISTLMERMGMEEDDEIQHPWLSRAIANAQRKVEGHNFQIRKNLLEFDDVMNQQRHTVYGRRRDILTNDNNRDIVLDMVDQAVTEIIEDCVPEKVEGEFDVKSLEERVLAAFNLPLSSIELAPEMKTQEQIGSQLYAKVVAHYDEREQANGPEVMRRVETILLLQTLDSLWKDHLLSMDHLREGIGLRGYGQRDPILEYKKEGYLLFRAMMNRFVNDSVGKLFRVQVSTQESLDRAAERGRPARPVNVSHESSSAFDASGPSEARGDHGRKQETVKREAPKVGRNDSCPCGSGKKYKKCCGQ
jgi:preprotein translocase subunit SecA